MTGGDFPSQVMSDPRCTKSGIYWSWNGNAQQVGLLGFKKDEKGDLTWEVQGAGGAGGEIFENECSTEVNDVRKAGAAWDLSLKAVGLA